MKFLIHGEHFEAIAKPIGFGKNEVGILNSDENQPLITLLKEVNRTGELIKIDHGDGFFDFHLMSISTLFFGEPVFVHVIQLSPYTLNQKFRDAMEDLAEKANNHYDGHFMLLKFTTNYRCCLGTIDLMGPDVYEQIQMMPEGKTEQEAINNALKDGAADAFDIIKKSAKR